MKKLLAFVLALSLYVGMLSGCSAKEEPVKQELPKFQSSTETEKIIADGYEELGGSWVVAGFYYKNHLIDLSDNDSLVDLYDTDYLTFYEGGTFHYMNLYNSRGKYIRQSDNSFILKTETVFTYDFAEEGLVEKVKEDANKASFIVTLLDENTLRWAIFDPLTGQESTDSDPLLFEREDTESAYIQQYKTPLNSDSSESTAPAATEKPAAAQKPAATPKAEKPSTQTTTSGMRNALKSAQNYLSVMPFSHSGLIDQLEYEGYSYSEAKYAADNCGADWYEQAARSAENYLDVMSFSRNGLIDQLEFEGYTHDQAVYGVDAVY